MSIKEMLSNGELDTIKSQVSYVINWSQGIPDPKVDQLIDDWFAAKEHFLNAFGGCIYEYGPVEFHLSDRVKQSRINDFVDRVVNTYGQDALGKFITENSAGFFTNQVVNDYDNIPRGMKLVRAFKYFQSENKGLLELLQNEASQIIQEDKVKGTLCFSVHPLDFLSSSSNDYNWRSCHALDGEFRAGNLSYMLDSSTVVCYLKGKDNAILPLFPPEIRWNSKKWRMLLYMSNQRDMVFAGRQYPFSTDDALEYVKRALGRLPLFRPIFDGYDFCGWETYVIDEPGLSSKYIKIYDKLHAINDIVDDKSGLHYNDLKWSHYYNPQYVIGDSIYWRNVYNDDKYVPHFTIGAKVKCLQCGEDWVYGGETMRCEDCEYKYGTEDNGDWGFCDCCGARTRWDDMIYINDDYHMCSNCFEEKGYVCPHCGEAVFSEDTIYDPVNETYYCRECMSAIQEERE